MQTVPYAGLTLLAERCISPHCSSNGRTINPPVSAHRTIVCMQGAAAAWGEYALHCRRCQPAGLHLGPPRCISCQPCCTISLLTAHALQACKRNTTCLSSQSYTELLQHPSCQQLTHFSAYRSACSACMLAMQLEPASCPLRYTNGTAT